MSAILSQCKDFLFVELVTEATTMMDYVEATGTSLFIGLITLSLAITDFIRKSWSKWLQKGQTVKFTIFFNETWVTVWQIVNVEEYYMNGLVQEWG